MSKFRQKVVLVVDDEEDMREVIEDSLEDSPLEIISAASAEAGAEAVENLVIDIAIIDVFMPGKGGLWLIGELKRQNPEADIIVISGGWQGMEAGKTLKAAEATGPVHTLNKPFLPAELSNLVMGLIEARERAIEARNAALLAGGTE